MLEVPGDFEIHPTAPAGQAEKLSEFAARHGVKQAATEPAGRYFEHHIKLLLPGPAVAGLVALTDLVTPHGARLSRNARRQRADDAQERFVNQRCHGVGLATAKRRLDELVETLQAAGYEIVAVEQEYVVFDSDLNRDRGWLNAPVAWA